MEIHLSEDLEKLVQEKVEGGRYRSPNEVIRRALLVLDERDQEFDTSATEIKAEVTPAKATEAWEELFRLGDALAVGDTQESGTLTEAVLAMRR